MTGDLLAYIRHSGTERFLIALNLGAEPHAVATPHEGTLALSTYLDRHAEPISRELHLRANEGIVIALS
ncbi:MAG: hypothetical protein JOZ93_11975 [Sinobacteraceae bacterium]|nr:hypothetical protein [Nevskiaceae bacterium]